MANQPTNQQARCLGGVPCLRCFERNLVCLPQQPPARKRGARPPTAATGGHQEQAAVTDGASHAEDNNEDVPNAFLASFLERWQPSAVAPAFAQAVQGLAQQQQQQLEQPPGPNLDWPPAGIRGQGGPTLAEPAAAAAAAAPGPLDQGLVAAAM